MRVSEKRLTVRARYKGLGFKGSMGVSQNLGVLFWGPYSKNPTI